MRTCRIYLPGSTWECTVIPHPNGADVYPELISADINDAYQLELERDEAIQQVRAAMSEREKGRAA